MKRQSSCLKLLIFGSFFIIAVVAVGRDGGELRLPFTGNDVLADDGFLYAVPTHRRTIEKRWMRRHGAENWPTGRKLIRPKTNILTCKDCGHSYEAGHLCGEWGGTSLARMTHHAFVHCVAT
jgi:hypothetical protein